MRIARILCPACLGIAIAMVPGAALAVQLLGLMLALVPALAAGTERPRPGPSVRW